MFWSIGQQLIHTSGNTALVSGFAPDGDVILLTNYGEWMEGSQQFLKELGWAANPKQWCDTCDYRVF